MTPNNAALPGVGFFHKTLSHDMTTGLVDPVAFTKFQKICSTGGDFADVPQTTGAAKLVNPRGGWAHDGNLGPDPRQMSMPDPPSALSDGTAAEMTELYWMALLRDKPFASFSDADADIQQAVVDMQAAFNRGAGSVIPCVDVPPVLNAQNVFRAGLPGEDKGPLVSQFFLNDIAYGTQVILQKQYPYKAGVNYLETWDSWLHAQNTGTGDDNKDYPNDNTGAPYYEADYRDPTKPGALKRIRNMRDLARFVNKDALHQAYFNAALLLNNWGAPVGKGNPYGNGRITNQLGFGTLGGPHLLALVSEVAARALRIVWHQKWGVYLRQRPEAYGGLMEAQRKGTAIGLPDWVFTTDGAKAIFDRTLADGSKPQNFLLPLAFSAGSPDHPAYGAGHATVAGACVTILKAWFNGSAKMSDVVKGQVHPVTGAPGRLVAPDIDGSDVLPEYMGADAAYLTVEGELNKLAANVALGRSMGGVHWRTDNTRSLRLGEKIATIILRRESMDYDEAPFWQYRNFDGNMVEVRPDGRVLVSGDGELTDFYNDPDFDPIR